MQVDVISTYNDKVLFEQMKKSLTNGNRKHEVNVIGMDNSSGTFPSAAHSYQMALKEFSTSQVLIFCHQDVVFGEGAVEKMVDCVLREGNAVVGVAGAIRTKKAPYNQIVSAIHSGRERFDTLRIGEVQNVFTLDECVIAMKREIFDKVQFDSVTCDGWHFYVVDLCLQCHQQGIPVKAVGVNARHLSAGRRDQAYRRAEKRMAEKWRRNYDVLVFTTGWTYTKRLPFLFLRCFRKWKGTI